MTPPKQITGLLPIALAVMALAGCAQPNGGRRAGLSAAQAQDCRNHSEQVYLQQNRADIYKSDIYSTSTKDAPFSNTGLPGITSAGLGDKYRREQALNDCYNASAGPDASGTATLQGPAAATPPK